MLVQELLNTKVEYEVKKARADEFVCIGKVGERFIEFTAMTSDADSTDEWDVEFGERKTEVSNIKYNITGSGNELEVLALVKDCFVDFIKRYKHPKRIVFTAAKENESSARGNVYERMLKRMNLDAYGYTYSRVEGIRKDKFEIIR